MEKDHLWEDDLKNSILQNKAIFSQLGNLGDTLVIYEKTIYQQVIADALIFSSNLGIIGVEIKTQHDTLKRLPHQLDSYVRTCAYTYVYCHDSKLDEVLKLLAKKHYDCVGVISYEEYDHQPLAGLIRKPTFSPYITQMSYPSLLWKIELKSVLEAVTHETVHGRVKQMANQLAELVPKQETQHIIAKMYINGLTDERKPLQRYNFHERYTHDITFRGDYHT